MDKNGLQMRNMMAAKARKDKKGYALRTGECQRKDGRYSYSYTDRGGVRHSIYAKTLVDLRARERRPCRERMMKELIR